MKELKWFDKEVIFDNVEDEFWQGHIAIDKYRYVCAVNEKGRVIKNGRLYYFVTGYRYGDRNKALGLKMTSGGYLTYREMNRINIFIMKEQRKSKKHPLFLSL
jgi:hypothetical protein